MDHVSLGARELSGTRAAAGASNFTAACKTRLRIALAESLLLVGCVVPAGTTQRGAAGSSFSSLTGAMPRMNFVRGIVTLVLASDTDALQWRLPDVHAFVRGANHRRTVRHIERLLKFGHVSE